MLRENGRMIRLFFFSFKLSCDDGGLKFRPLTLTSGASKDIGQNGNLKILKSETPLEGAKTVRSLVV